MQRECGGVSIDGQDLGRGAASDKSPGCASGAVVSRMGYAAGPCRLAKLLAMPLGHAAAGRLAAAVASPGHVRLSSARTE